VPDLTLDQSVFTDTLEQYMQVTKRTVAQVINTKSWYVARKAIWFTDKSDKGMIESSLGRMVKVDRLTKSGKTVRRRQLELVSSSQQDAPLAALIINARRGRKGIPGLYGKAMTAAIRDLLASRGRSTAFLKSGWLGAVKKLGPLADKAGGTPPIDDKARRYGLEKGYADPAEPGFDVTALIVNEACTRHDATGSALQRVGGKGLQIAFDDEAASMQQYIEDHLRPDAEEFNRRQR
jgi:hypothetical protein